MIYYILFIIGSKQNNKKIIKLKNQEDLIYEEIYYN